VANCYKLYPADLNPINRMSLLAVMISITLGPVIALVAGILILIVPRLLSFIVAIYLIIVGLNGLLHLGLY
jgi:Protein of unknown function (DUF3096)